MFQKSSRWINLGALALLLGSGLAFDVSAENAIVVLRNGDRISGNLITNGTAQVVVSNSYAGQISIAREQVVRVETASAPTNAVKESTVTLSGPSAARLQELLGLYNSNRISAVEYHEQRARLLAPGAVVPQEMGTRIVLLPPPGSSETPPSVRALGRPTGPTNAPAAKHWSGEAQMGVDLAFSTTDRQLFNGRAKLIYANKPLRNTFDYSFTYGRTAGILSANQMTAMDKLDYDLSERYYLYNLFGAGFDAIRQLDLHIEEGPGAGFRISRGPATTLRAEYGLNYQYDNYSRGVRTEAGFHRFAEDFTWKISSQLAFDEKFEFFPRLAEWDRFRLRLEANLRYSLTGSIYLTATVLNLYNTDPPHGVNRNDLQLKSAIGMKF